MSFKFLFRRLYHNVREGEYTNGIIAVMKSAVEHKVIQTPSESAGVFYENVVTKWRYHVHIDLWLFMIAFKFDRWDKPGLKKATDNPPGPDMYARKQRPGDTAHRDA